jgi:2-hydroxychromene-2-carboxylate isomerase
LKHRAKDPVSAPIDFYFDFSSPYGYLAATQIDTIAARHAREVVWHPILLGAVFKTTGQQPLASIPLKGEYAKRDLVRSARLLKLPFRIPSTFPMSAVAPSRAFYFAAAGDPEKAKRLALALFRAYFVDDRDISQAAMTASVAAGEGYDPREIDDALHDEAVKARLRREVDAALARGVFGSPYFIVDGEPFWGADRLTEVERWLETGGW